ncbi:Type 1 glutamine amidotransferase-like domain-containing protein [Kitasatospora sp. NPDC088391]|uniref:Type 1 glutamine amidotransferase-like domain-containing protein n=1 Tax=Kitasatospora sp. NPDC088391 TaxID=3364074 RepID=UPI00381FB83F
MKLLLTDAGVQNESIRGALVDLLGKPIAESTALCIPTAGYGGPYGSPTGPWRFVSGQSQNLMTGLGWKSVGVLELTALPGLDRERWVSWVREADVLLVNGGDPMYLAHWMRASGLAELLPTLPDTVYVGLSAGSMVLTPRVGDAFVDWRPHGGEPRADDDLALGLVDFSIFPHLDHPSCPENTTAEAERWAAGMPHRAYATDEHTAIKVVDGVVEVVSEGRWLQFDPAR